MWPEEFVLKEGGHWAQCVGIRYFYNQIICKPPSDIL